MSRIRNFLVLASFGFAVWAAPVAAQSPKPPPFRPFPAGPAPQGSPKPPPFRPKPPPPKPIPPVAIVPVNPGNGVTPTPDDEQQRRRRMFVFMMLRQQALTRAAMQQAALQQAALATALANQSAYQPSYPQPYPMSYPTPTPPATPTAKEQPAAEVALLAGLVDAAGKVAWPLGLQIARPALETKTLRERIDGLVRVAAKQAAYGQVQRGILDEAKQLLADLRKAFDNSRRDMPERTAQDADAFLTRLNTSLQAMQGGDVAKKY